MSVYSQFTQNECCISFCTCYVTIWSCGDILVFGLTLLCLCPYRKCFRLEALCPSLTIALRSKWCRLLGYVAVMHNVEFRIKLHCWKCGNEEWFFKNSLCFRMLWWWDFFCCGQRGRTGMPSMLGVLQHCWKCAPCLMVWPHPCKICILGLQWSVLKVPTLPVQLPLFISCPWCNLLSFRLVYNGHVKFPRKNYFLLWMLESMNGDRVKTQSTFCGDHQPLWPIKDNLPMGSRVSHGNLRRGQYVRHSEPLDSDQTGNYRSIERLHSFVRMSLVFLVHLTAKFPLIIIFLLIVLYVIPASAAILALYILVTILFAFPSLLILYFAYPSLVWLVREIITWHHEVLYTLYFVLQALSLT